MNRPILVTAFASVLLATGLAACGSDSGSTTTSPSLPPAAAAGHRTFRDSGCAACHGANGEGGVGPRLQGVYGTEVELEDGSTVVADEAYLERSIRDPGADKHKGYRVPMPQNDLDDDEIASIVEYIRAIGSNG